MKLNAKQLASHLEKNLAPCYLVTGDEHLLVDEALDGIRGAARARGFTSRESHVATRGFDWAAMSSAGANLSLFAERRIVELRLPTGKPGRDGSAAIAAFVDKLADDIMLIVSAPKIDKKSMSAKWVKALDVSGVVMQIWPVGPRDLPGWIGDRMRRAGLRPERAAVQMIADRVEGNLLAANQEIEKLRLLLGEGDISAADVSKAVADSSRFDVYKLVDAAVEGDAGRAIRILNGIQAEGVKPPIVSWAIARELRVLARLAERVSANQDLGDAMRSLYVWQNRQGIVRRCVSRHSRDDFYALIKAVMRADAAAKGQGPGDAWQLYADILLNLSQSGRRAA